MVATQGIEAYGHLRQKTPSQPHPSAPTWLRRPRTAGRWRTMPNWTSTALPDCVVAKAESGPQWQPLGVLVEQRGPPLVAGPLPI
jgi:hypothetical protein